MCNRLFMPLLILFFLSFNLFPQVKKEDETSIQKWKIKLIEQILVDASNLKLPENRAVIYAEVADNLWSSDEKRARELFRKSIDELITAQQEIHKLKNPEKYNDLYYGNSPRRVILNLIAEHDAEFALELLLKSRPQIISEILQKTSNNSVSEYSKKLPYLGNNIEWELEQEQKFYLATVEQNPEKSDDFFRESLKKGVSRQILTSLFELNRKKPELSNRFAEELAKKLIDLELSKTNQKNYAIILDFFNSVENSIVINSDRINISEQSYRALADKISAFWLEGNWNSSVNSREFNIIEKIFPERIAKLRSIYSEKINQFSGQYPNNENQKFNELKLSNSSPEEILKQVENFSSYRDQVYSLAIEKFLKRGDVEITVNLIKETHNKNMADYKISSIYSNLALETFRKGDLNSAIQWIDKTPNYNSQIETLVTIASEIYQKSPVESQNLAESLFNKGLIYLESEDDSSSKKGLFLQLAKGFAVINSRRAFSMTESVILQINSYNRALVVTSKFKDGSNRYIYEFPLPNSNNSRGSRSLTGGVYFDGVLTQLAIKNFQQTILLINKFERPEIRFSLKLNLIESLNRIQGKAN